MALLTPALTYGYPDPEYINFYYGHGLILIGVGMPVFVLKERPQFADFIFVVKVTLAMTAIIFILNHLLGEGANFWYLKKISPMVIRLSISFLQRLFTYLD